jgi:hypothetical protein
MRVQQVNSGRRRSQISDCATGLQRNSGVRRWTISVFRALQRKRRFTDQETIIKRLSVRVKLLESRLNCVFLSIPARVAPHLKNAAYAKEGFGQVIDAFSYDSYHGFCTDVRRNLNILCMSRTAIEGGICAAGSSPDFARDVRCSGFPSFCPRK